MIGMENITERDAAIAYARAWNRLDCSEFIEMLTPDAHYASQWVLDELKSKTAIAEYLTGKMSAVEKSGNKVFAELGVTTISFPDRDCVIMAQGNKDPVMAVVLFEVEGGHVKRFDLCIPDLLRAKRSGQYP